MNGRRTKRYLINLLLNVGIVFLSYLLAVFLRYRVFAIESDKAINPFSLPFLIIALVYSVIVSFTFDYVDYPRYLVGDGIFNGVSRIIFQNIIGCIGFLAVLFVAGIVNFSRWGIFLFGVISSMGLILKQVLMYSVKARKRCSGKDVRRVLLVGNGNQAKDYIKSIIRNPQFGIQVVGYLGADNRLETNLEGWFQPEAYPFPVIKWLGTFSPEKVREIVKEQRVEEVIVTENIDIDTLSDSNPEISLVLPYSNYINRGSRIRDLGEAKTVRVNEKIARRSNAKIGMIISLALLLVILIMKKFHLNTVEPVYTMDGIEKSRSILFAFFGFFMYWAVTDRMGPRRHSMIYGAAMTMIACTALIMVYEWIDGGRFWDNVRMDLLPVVIVIALFFFAKEIVKKISESFIGV